MSGWVLLALLFGIGLVGLRLLKVRGAVLKLAAAGLLLGASGYALQGRPDLRGEPRSAAASAELVPLSAARRAFFGEFSGNQHWLLISDSMSRRGDTADAVGILRSAIREHPRDAQLWIGLGNSLVDHARGLNPPAELAFARAAELAPNHPGPNFFLGLAKARSGDREGALRQWHAALVAAPADASWRPLVEDAIAAFSAPNTSGVR
jgi:cytochrome c-type biogenesis protein CcmH